MQHRALVDGRVLARDVKLADTFFLRLIGLLRHKKLENGEGLLIRECKQVHSFGMKFNIDVIFLSRIGEILHIENDMRPGRISKYVKEATQVLELKAGTAKEKNVKPQKRVTFEICP